jgi:hypothetical protein
MRRIDLPERSGDERRVRMAGAIEEALALQLFGKTFDRCRDRVGRDRNVETVGGRIRRIPSQCALDGAEPKYFERKVACGTRASTAVWRASIV